MADLNALIRVQKHALDQKRKFLAELYRQAEDLEAAKDSMLETLAQEREKLDDMAPEMLSYFSQYAQGVKARVAEIDGALATLNARIDAAREDIRAAFAELKKVEMTQAAREAEAAAELSKKESDALNEIALETHRRKQSEG